MTVNDTKQTRQAEHNIDPLFIERWSPRSFADEPVEEDVLLSILEAAKWAPSASNEQPWRYIIARTDEDRARFYKFIMNGNLKWCTQAPVLLLLVSDTVSSRDTPNTYHAFDAGTSWAFLSLQAAKLGLVAHAMAGFHVDQAKELLHIPEQFVPLAVIALGYQGEREALTPELQEREIPSTRRMLKDTLYEGTFQTRIK